MKNILLPLIALIILSCSKKEEELSQGAWNQKKDFAGKGRKIWISFDINGKGYAGLGIDDMGVNYNDFWEYDASSDSWTQKNGYQGFIPIVASTSIGSKGYVISYEGTLHEYDPALSSWTPKKNFPGTNHRNQMVGFSLNGMGYFGFGFDTGTLSSYSDLWEYNPQTDQWRRLADFPRAIDKGASSFSFPINGSGYVGISSGSATIFKDLYAYSPASNEWVKKADLPNGSQQVNFWFTNNSQGYIGTSTTQAAGTVVWVYDASKNSWRQVSSVPSKATINAVCFTVNGKSYVVAGWNGTFSKEVWEFTP